MAACREHGSINSRIRDVSWFESTDKEAQNGLLVHWLMVSDYTAMAEAFREDMSSFQAEDSGGYGADPDSVG